MGHFSNGGEVLNDFMNIRLFVSNATLSIEIND